MAQLRSAVDIAEAIRGGDLRAAEVVEACLARIDAANDDLHCFRETFPDEARRAAAAIDGAVAAGRDPGPLAGVPIAVKDTIVTRLGRSACGSRMLADYRSPFDATAVERVLAAGAVVIGRTNCDEFAMGSSSEHCAFATPVNPWDAARVPGGSSGGSAAAVAADLCPAALGSDTGGSIRQPAALCGVTGLKPTYGRVSRHGLVAFGSSLDQVGPITRDARDAARLLAVIAGADPRDSTCADLPPPDDLEALDADPAGLRVGLRVGLVRGHLADDNHPAVNAATRAAVETLRGLGATIVDVDLPLTDAALSAYYVINPAEASSNLARYDGIRYGRRAEPAPGEGLADLYARSRAEGFGAEVRRRILLGTFVLSAGYHDAYYLRALSVRRLVRREYDAAFARCDVILGPTTPGPAFRIGERADPLSMYLGDVYTVGANIAGHAAISLPAGTVEVDGAVLPVGVQLQAPPMREDLLLAVAAAFQRATDHHEARPPRATEARSA